MGSVICPDLLLLIETQVGVHHCSVWRDSRLLNFNPSRAKSMLGHINTWPHSSPTQRWQLDVFERKKATLGNHIIIFCLISAHRFVY